MKIVIHNSHFNNSISFDGNYKMAYYYLMSSFLSKETISINNIPEDEKVYILIECLKKIGCNISFYNDEKMVIILKNKDIKNDEVFFDCKSNIDIIFLLLPLALNIFKKVTFFADKKTIEEINSTYLPFYKTNNFFMQIKDNKIVCSGTINLDYYDLTHSDNIFFITGFVINSLYINKAATIKVNFNCLNNLDYNLMQYIFNRSGFDLNCNDDIIYTHRGYVKQWKMVFLEGDYALANYFIALAAINGKLIAYHLFEDSKQPEYNFINIIRKCGGYLKYINDEETILYVENKSLLEKGIKKQLNSFIIDANEFNYSTLCLLICISCFFKGKSIVKNYTFSTTLIDILKNDLNVDIKIINNEVQINGKKDYKIYKSLKACNIHEIDYALIIFSLLNCGQIIIEDINNSYNNFISILINGCKNEAITFK